MTCRICIVVAVLLTAAPAFAQGRRIDVISAPELVVVDVMGDFVEVQRKTSGGCADQTSAAQTVVFTSQQTAGVPRIDDNPGVDVRVTVPHPLGSLRLVLSERGSSAWIERGNVVTRMAVGDALKHVVDCPARWAWPNATVAVRSRRGHWTKPTADLHVLVVLRR